MSCILADESWVLHSVADRGGGGGGGGGLNPHSQPFDNIIHSRKLGKIVVNK